MKSRNGSGRSKPRTRTLWITDPDVTLDHAADTSLSLIEALESQGVACDRIDPSQLTLPTTESARPLVEYSRIYYRVDPPVDEAYEFPLRLLISEARRLGRDPDRWISNPPSLLLSTSEKLIGWELGLAPPGLVAASSSNLADFCRRLSSKGHRVVLKPLHLAQSREIAEAKEPSLESDLKRLTASETRPILAQLLLPGVETQGETRFWFHNGTLLGALQKRPKTGGWLINMDAGSTLEPASPQQMVRLRSKTNRVSAYLKKHRIEFAAVDFIDGYVTDFNITSPGLLRELGRLTNRDWASWVARRMARSLRPNPVARRQRS